MQGDSNIGRQMAKGSNERDSSLTETNVNPVVEERSAYITAERGQEHKGNDDVTQVIIFFKIWDYSLETNINTQAVLTIVKHYLHHMLHRLLP